MRIEQLYLFPVKSLAPVELRELHLTETGPALDRAWMVVDEAGKFVTQRELPRMSQVQPSLDLEESALVLALKEDATKSIKIPLRPRDKKQSGEVRIWSDSLSAADCGAEAAAFLSSFLGQPLRLVRLTDPRTKEGEHARALSFVDDYPIHVASLSSLADLNARLPGPLGILRFRPNIVVSGAEPWEEDHWKSLRAGGHELRAGRACTRCAITTVDPQSGARGPEPLKTLAGFRRNAKNKIEFGLYLHSAPGAVLRVGEELTATYKRNAPESLRARQDG